MNCCHSSLCINNNTWTNKYIYKNDFENINISDDIKKTDRNITNTKQKNVNKKFDNGSNESTNNSDRTKKKGPNKNNIIKKD